MHPLITNAVLLALGDSYHKSRIIGTTDSYFRWMELSLREGRMFEQDFEAVIGSELADHEHIRTGDTLMSNHGLTALDLDTKHEHGFARSWYAQKAKQPGGQVDFLPTISTYWKEHDHGDTEGELSAHQDTPVLRNSDLEILTMIKRLSVSNPIQRPQYPESQFRPKCQWRAANLWLSPAIEISRLYRINGYCFRHAILDCRNHRNSLHVCHFYQSHSGTRRTSSGTGILRIGGASRSLLLVWWWSRLDWSSGGTITGWLLPTEMFVFTSNLTSIPATNKGFISCSRRMDSDPAFSYEWFGSRVDSISPGIPRRDRRITRLWFHFLKKT